MSARDVSVELPRGFETIRDRRLEIVVRSAVREQVLPLLRAWSIGAPPPGRPLQGGRGGVRAFDLGSHIAVVLRPYRRGGCVARFNRDLYCGTRPRPFRELIVTEALRERGVPTLEMVAAAVRWVVPGCYRGALVSREVAGAVNLWEYLQSIEPQQRAGVCEVVATVTRQLHRSGAVHPDLNLQNYLVCRRNGQLEVLIIDCDGVRLGRVSSRDRHAAFDRLCRSIRRLDPASAVVTLGCVQALQSIEDDGQDSRVVS